jgi:16S rRNA processing protein RimM
VSGASERGAPADPAIVGRVVRPHGLAGEVVVEPVDSSPVSLEPGSIFWLDDRWISVTRSRVANRGRWVIALEGVADRDAAEELRGAELVVETDELPELESGHYYIHDLVGCRVEDTAGDDLGEVVAVVPGPRDWLEIERDGQRSLVPMAKALLKEVDLQERRIVIDPPSGLAEATRD